MLCKKTATVIAASRILRWHCFKCKIPSSAITLHMIFFPSGTFLFFIIYSAIFPPDAGIFLPPQKNAAALYAFCSIFYSYGICLCQRCNFLYFNFWFCSLSSVCVNCYIAKYPNTNIVTPFKNFIHWMCSSGIYVIFRNPRIICTYSSTWASFHCSILYFLSLILFFNS